MRGPVQGLVLGGTAERGEQGNPLGEIVGELFLRGRHGERRRHHYIVVRPNNKWSATNHLMRRGYHLLATLESVQGL